MFTPITSRPATVDARVFFSGVLLICSLGSTLFGPFTRCAEAASGDLIQPRELQYLGAFRLPDASGGSNWEYSGYAMTYYPGGDAEGPDDGFPGSLFAVGHDHHQMVAEISIPAPKTSRTKNAAELNAADTLQPFRDIRGGQFAELEIPRAGLEYLPPQGDQRTAKLHYCWGQHFQEQLTPSHGWSELDLSRPQPAGPWQIGDFSNYVTNDYLFEIPADWAAKYAPGLRLATGRFRDGQWGGLGPALLGIAPWTEGAPPAPGAVLRNVKPLMMYGRPVPGAAELAVSPEHAIRDFRESDEWSGGAWLTAGGKSAVVLVGTKGTGKCWYGFSNGVVYPLSGDEDEPTPAVPDWPHDQRGWWSERVEGFFLFFDPRELAEVAQGKQPTWAPQPYATMSIDRYLYRPGYDYQRGKMNVLGACAFDRARARLYVMER
ncbi:MAG: hypothetical protein KDA37_07740, partial [Planctomycetales bacterium]|nr:hypothetical protein [Planctomycetales bacterium]